MTASTFQLRLIGRPCLLAGGVEQRLPRRKALAALAYLAGQRRPVARERLAALLWPDATPGDARVSLRRVLADLAAVLGRGWYREPDGDSLAVDTGIESDVEQLDRLLARAASLKLEDYDPWLDAGLAPLMDGLEFAGLDVWNEWRYVEGEALRRRQRELAARASAAALAAGDATRALAWSRAWRSLDPLDEAALRAELRALALDGQLAALPASFKAFSEHLARELDVAPEAQTRALFDRLRQGRPGRAQAPVADWSRAPVRYVRVGDIYLASRVIGEHGPWLTLVSGFVSHLEFMERDARLSSWMARLAQGRRVLLFDKRAMGLSDRTGAPPTPERTADDLVALLDAHGADQSVVMGVSEGGPAGLHAARSHPGRIAGLVLYGTTARWVAAEDYSEAIPAEAYALWIERLQRHWGDATSVADFAPSLAGDPATVHWWSQLLRAAASPGAIRSILEAAAHVDCRAWIGDLRCPALVLHRSEDRMLRVGNGRWLARQLPDARYVELAGRDHWFWAGDTDPMHAAIDRFIDELGAASNVAVSAPRSPGSRPAG